MASQAPRSWWPTRSMIPNCSSRSRPHRMQPAMTAPITRRTKPMANKQETAAQEQGEVLEKDDFSALLQKEFRPKSERAKSEVESAVRTLAQQVLEGTALVSEDTVTTINALVAEIDSRLTEQVNQIIHHEDFQKLEGAWRGLHYHVMNTETDEMLKIRVMNIFKDRS